MGDVSKDDDFPDATIMTINVEGVPKEYQKIIGTFMIRISKSTMLCGFTTPPTKLPQGIHLFS